MGEEYLGGRVSSSPVYLSHSCTCLTFDSDSYSLT